MKRTVIAILIFSCFNLCGCSIPSSARYSYIYSLTREQKTVKGSMGYKRKDEIIKDFRENEMYIEDIKALKEEAEKYIAVHPELSDSIKSSLRELKVTEGNSKEEVLMLLGEPDKTIKKNHGESEIWIYRINRLRAFTFFIFPVYFAHEGYYLYFTGDSLRTIEKHLPRQIVHQAPSAGLTQKSK